jgi:septum formation protein
MKTAIICLLLYCTVQSEAFLSKFGSWGLGSHQSLALQMALIVSQLEDLGITVQVILASQSPRRREILDMMGLKGKYIVCPSPLDESLLQRNLSNEDPKVYTRRLAEEKARALAEELSGEVVRPTLVLGSDTIVDLEGKILEKPLDAEAAIRMLHLLSGQTHEVHTGVAIFGVMRQPPFVQMISSFTETAQVQFAVLTDEDISSYVKTGEPMDKAGAYGIQGIGGQLVTNISGDFFTVMGLPMHRTSVEITRSLKILTSA